MPGGLWRAHEGEFVSRVFRREPPGAGRPETGCSRSSLRGSYWLGAVDLAVARVHGLRAARGHSRAGGGSPLVVLIHGCRQTAGEDRPFATRITVAGGPGAGLPVTNSCRDPEPARERVGMLGTVVLIAGRPPGAGDGDRSRASRAVRLRSTGSIPGNACLRRRPASLRRRRSPPCWASGGPPRSPACSRSAPPGIACGAASTALLAALGVLQSGADTDIAQIARHARASTDETASWPARLAASGQPPTTSVVRRSMPRSSFRRVPGSCNGHPAAVHRRAPACRSASPDRRDGSAAAEARTR